MNLSRVSSMTVRGLGAVYLVQIDVVSAQLAKAILEGFVDLVGRVVRPGELGCQEDLVAPALQSLAEQLLRVRIALSRVDES